MAYRNRLVGTRLTCAAAGVMAVALIVGCGTSNVGDASDHGHTHEGEEDGQAHEAGDQNGWWCVEHGVPEEVCTRCDSSLVAEFKEKEDWCQQHSRPESQCFVCSPELQARFAVRYEAKYGTQPPAPTDP